MLLNSNSITTCPRIVFLLDQGGVCFYIVKKQSLIWQTHCFDLGYVVNSIFFPYVSGINNFFFLSETAHFRYIGMCESCCSFLCFMYLPIYQGG